MKLLICTQKVDKNDDILGFFHSWIAEFARNCEQVTVICLYKGEIEMSENVRVLSLGKENQLKMKLPATRYRLQANYLILFYKYIWQERRNYDNVFVHMNSIYVLLGGLLWKIWQKKIGLWYAHGHAPWELRVSEKLVGYIFTSTVSGCQLKSNKIQIVGQGIDFEKFIKDATHVEVWPPAGGRTSVKLITVGRISPIKDLVTLICAVEVLIKKGIDVKLDIIGAIGLAEQKTYYDLLVELVKEKRLEDKVSFIGAVPNNNIVKYLQNADIFVSASRTGSLDKTFLEAMACGLPVIGCNEALLTVLGVYQDKLFFPAGDYNKLGELIQGVINISESEYLTMRNDLREVVVKEHGLGGFIEKIIRFYK